MVARKFQISIRALLATTLVAAIALTVWANRPRGSVLIKVDETGFMLVDDQPSKKQDLTDLLKSKHWWHDTWGKDCEVVVKPASSTRTTEVADIVECAQDAGLEYFKLRMLEDDQELGDNP